MLNIIKKPLIYFAIFGLLLQSTFVTNIFRPQKAQAADITQNTPNNQTTEPTPTSNLSNSSVQTEIIKPTSTISYPLDGGFYNSLNPITGTTSDTGGPGLANVKIKLENSEGKFLNQGDIWGSFDENTSWRLATGTVNWMYLLDSSLLTSGQVYTLYHKATDTNGIEEDYSSISFNFDNVAPTGAIKINDNEGVTNSVNVTLHFKANEQYQMKVTGDGSFSPVTTQATWIPFQESGDWILSEGNGFKTVNVQYRDQAGNVSEEYSAHIYLNNSSNVDNTNITNSQQDYQIYPDLQMFVNADSNITLFSSRYSGNPLDKNPSGMTTLGKYFDFSVSDSSKITFPVNIKIYFTEADLANAGITNVSQISGLYFWDFDNSNWKLYSGTDGSTGVVYDTNSATGYVWANVNHFTPMSIGADITSPGKPANLQASSSDNKINLSWDKVSDANSYNVRYKVVNSTDSYTVLGLSGNDNNKIDISSLKNGTMYEFGVQSLDGFGNASDWTTVFASPAKPTETSPVPTVSTAKNTFIGQAQAANETSDNGLSKQNTNIASDDVTVNGAQTNEATQESTRTWVTIAIIIIAIGAAMGGYYGYQWWMTKEKAEITVKETKKDRKSSGRW